jgi:large subunit ribosomal protein L13
LRPLFGEVPTNRETVSKNWLLIDAENLVLGRLSSQVAKILRGKHKPDFTPHVDGGDNVIIINAAKIKMTGNKFNDKVYTRYTGYPGGQRFTTPGELMTTYPERMVELAIGTEHPHAAQNPTTFDIKPLL